MPIPLSDSANPQPPGGPRSCAAAADSAAIAELLAQDRHKLLLRHPFTGAVVMRLDLRVERAEGLETAATNGCIIKVNPDFYASLDDDERLFVIAHEAWHCILMHFARRRDRDPMLFNVATDLEIHFLLTKEGFRPPFVLPHESSWNGLSAEEIYERLPPSPNAPSISSGGPRIVAAASPQPSQSRTMGEPRSGAAATTVPSPAPYSRPHPLVESAHIRSRDGQGFDQHEEPTGEEARDAVEKMRQVVVSAAQSFEQMRGTLPGHLEKIVKAMLRPSFDWRAMLARFVTSCYGGGRRWLPPSRRHVHRGLYLPSTRQERLNAVVAIDTSGSTERVLPAFFSELRNLLGSFGGYTLTVMQCDHGIQSVRTFSSDEGPVPPNVGWRARGFGGTSFVPVFQYVEDHPELEPTLLVFFTDGEGTAPAKAPPYPVLWILTPNGKSPAPWGAVARFPL